MRPTFRSLWILSALTGCSPDSTDTFLEAPVNDPEGDDAADPSPPAARPDVPLVEPKVMRYGPGALIIPMDTTYQDDGMLRAFGLTYALLSAAVPVQWIIEPGKGFGDADFTAQAVNLVAGVPTGASFSHDYRGGPFVVDAADLADALPIVTAFQTTYPEVAVHQAVGDFDGYVARSLVAAPTIAMFADGNQKIARGYMQAAGIPDSTGNLAWPDTSPDMLDVAEVSGPTSGAPHNDGALFDENGVPVYCQLMSMHWGVSDAVANPEVVAEVREYLNNPVHFFAECQAVNAFENLVPHGFFLTPNGFLIGDGQGAVDYYNLDQPFAQLDGPWGPEGGSEPSYTLPPGDSYLAGDIVMVTEAGTPEGVNDIWMTGYLDGLCPPSAESCFGVGKISYLGGHSYSSTPPMTGNANNRGTRMFLNSLFEAPCAESQGVAAVFLEKSGPALTDVPDVTYTIDYYNVGQSSALNVTISDTIPTGSTYVDSCCGGVFAGGVVTWDLGNLGAGEFGSLTVDVSFPDYGSYDDVAHADYLAGVTPFGADSNVVTTVYAAATCSDGVQNQDESDVDCGGSICPSCGNGGSCVDDGDCSSGVCIGGTCQPPACGDGVQNQDETDVDCGGSCSGCGVGGGCATALDCASGVCVGMVCQAPTCSDGAQNQGETGIDCGGPCPGCGVGDGCTTGDDCTSGVCTAGTCQAATCLDGLQNQDETGADCGGAICPACADGGGCAVAGDCVSGVCMGMVCQSAGCADGVQNQGETDVDCGGAACPPCPDGGTCGSGADCASMVCAAMACQPSSCVDGVHNQDESDVDCGGASCPACGMGDGCAVASDCASGVCVGMVCLAAACGDGVENQDETDVDCGGATCPACPDGGSCALAADCASGVCMGDVCQSPTCADGTLNADETDVDCGGTTCPACDDGGSCIANGDCASGSCVGNACQSPACDDGVLNADETDLDCGGTSCSPCGDGGACLVDADCASGVCSGGTCQMPACDDGVSNGDETEIDCGGSCPDCSATGSGGADTGETDGNAATDGSDSGGPADDTGDGQSGSGGAEAGDGSTSGGIGTSLSDDGSDAADTTGDGTQTATDGGCSCRQQSRPLGPAGLAWFALGLVGVRRRRRAERDTNRMALSRPGRGG